MQTLRSWLEAIKSWLEFPILHLGETRITLWTLLYFLLLLTLLYWLAGRLRWWLVHQLLPRTRMEMGARQAVGSITRYLVLLIGLVIVLQTVGINLTTLNVLAGAVGVGIGFGLQNIANNFISGLIILFERPIKVGDRIEVGNIDGEVKEIGARSTTVLTNDNISIIVPNSNFITENVVNWKYADARVRFHIPIGVAYGSDAREVARLLREVAAENSDVLSEPPPKVWFRGFGDSSLDFELLVWNTSLVDRKGQFISDLNFAVYDKLNEHGIEIPFPQQDLHIRSGVTELLSGTQVSKNAREKAGEPTE
jgi:small-conductance mechanosensitive channel